MIDQPCLIHLHVISLVRRQVRPPPPRGTQGHLCSAGRAEPSALDRCEPADSLIVAAAAAAQELAVSGGRRCGWRNGQVVEDGPPPVVIDRHDLDDHRRLPLAGRLEVRKERPQGKPLS